MTLQALGEPSGEEGLGSQSYVPFSLPKDPDTAEDTTKYVSFHSISPMSSSARSLSSTVLHPLASVRLYLSCDDRLEDKREDYQNCSQLYCVLQLQ